MAGQIYYDISAIDFFCPATNRLTIPHHLTTRPAGIPTENNDVMTITSKRSGQD